MLTMRSTGAVLNVSLDCLELNQPVKIISVLTNDSAKLKKLMAMSIFPGMEVTLIQKFPSYVFQIGYSQFVVDRKLAECILCGEAPTQEVEKV